MAGPWSIPDSPPSSTADQLNDREIYDFDESRQRLFWLLPNHDKVSGYAEATAD